MPKAIKKKKPRINKRIAVAKRYAKNVLKECEYPYLRKSMEYFLKQAGRRRNLSGKLDEICEWIEGLETPEGGFGKFKLFDWQLIVLAYMFEFKKCSKTTVVLIPRKNGKTSLLAAIALATMKFVDDKQVEIGCFATKSEQARRTFDHAAMIIQQMHDDHPDKNLFSVLNTVIYYDRQGKNKKMKYHTSANKTMDGLAPTLAILDESCAMEAKTHIVIASAAAKTRETQRFIHISTANDDPTCYTRELYLGAFAEMDAGGDPPINPLIYEPPFEKEKQPKPDDVNAWKMLNPSWGVMHDEESVRADWEMNKHMSSGRGEFLRKRMNIWTTEGRQVMCEPDDVLAVFADPEKWDDSPFENNVCSIGVDISKNGDMTCVSLVTRDEDTGIYYCKNQNYLNRDAYELKIHKTRQTVLEDFVKDGYLIITGDRMIDYTPIEFLIKSYCDKYTVVNLTTDVMTAGDTLTDFCSTALPIAPTTLLLSRSNKAGKINIFLSAFQNKKMVMKHNPLFLWECMHASLKPDITGSFVDIVKLLTAQSTAMIDGIYALVFAMSYWENKRYYELPEGDWDGKETGNQPAMFDI